MTHFHIGGLIMGEYKIKKDGHYIVPCTTAIPEDPKGIVVAVHGFASSKDCQTYQLLKEILPPAGLGMVGLELPGHGTEEAADELLRINGAIDSIEAVENYVAKTFPDQPIYYFASSFGAYLTALYMSKRSHRGRKAFFRSAAVNMPRLIVKVNPTEEEKKQIEELEANGYYDTVMEDVNLRSVRITKDLYEDFQVTDLFELFDGNLLKDHQILMAHGEKDVVIDPKAAKSFARQFGIPIRIFEGEGHSLGEKPGTAREVISMARDFYLS